MNESRIPLAGPSITDAEVARVAAAARHAWGEHAGAFRRRFESAFAAWVGRRYALALPSCTSAIHLALAALGVGAGDEVIVPELTWIASAAPITYVGAAPVFVDIDPANWCICPDSLQRAITARTKAVIAVDLYGNMPDMPRVLNVAAERGIAVIEDAAEALGADQGGRRAGAFGRVSVFSFHGSKTLTTGEGGMLLTDDEALYRRCLTLADHGREPGDRWFWNHEVALRYAMSDLQAAFGLAQLERIEQLLNRKRRIFDWYRAGLADRPDITLNPDQADTHNAYWMCTAVVDPSCAIDKRELMSGFDRHGIDTRPMFHPLSSLPAYAHLGGPALAAARNPKAYHLSPRGINLPSGLQLSADDVSRVCAAFKTILS
ncbi:MAG: DegT/DnrJ/EryC1/StrS family aminotransferase [Planctomycetota bacterium]|nr:DegT/DnrJ/EryC1/StrS family aminotransferase [Planctomycetota bacterium]